MKLLLDEMLSPRIALSLRTRGHDAVSVGEVSVALGASDEDTLLVAAAQGRVVVTRNLGDFRVPAHHALREGTDFDGVILVSARSFPERDPRTTGRLVTALLALLEADVALQGQEFWLQ